MRKWTSYDRKFINYSFHGTRLTELEQEKAVRASCASYILQLVGSALLLQAHQPR